jgi:hypothetical protein
LAYRTSYREPQSRTLAGNSRNDGDYHGDEAITRLANLMKRDKEDLYLP